MVAWFKEQGVARLAVWAAALLGHALLIVLLENARGDWASPEKDVFEVTLVTEVPIEVAPETAEPESAAQVMPNPPKPAQETKPIAKPVPQPTVPDIAPPKPRQDGAGETIILPAEPERTEASSDMDGSIAAPSPELLNALRGVNCRNVSGELRRKMRCDDAMVPSGPAFRLPKDEQALEQMEATHRKTLEAATAFGNGFEWYFEQDYEAPRHFKGSCINGNDTTCGEDNWAFADKRYDGAQDVDDVRNGRTPSWQRKIQDGHQ